MFKIRLYGCMTSLNYSSLPIRITKVWPIRPNLRYKFWLINRLVKEHEYSL
jgi:hypothetical protein